MLCVLLYLVAVVLCIAFAISVASADPCSDCKWLNGQDDGDTISPDCGQADSEVSEFSTGCDGCEFSWVVDVTLDDECDVLHIYVDGVEDVNTPIQGPVWPYDTIDGYNIHNGPGPMSLSSSSTFVVVIACDELCGESPSTISSSYAFVCKDCGLGS